MKIRIQDNTIRFRLSISELNDLSEGLTVTNSTPLSDGNLFCALCPVSDDGHSSVTDGKLSIHIPQILLSELNKNQEEGFQIQVGESSIAIEKDYQCIGRSELVNEGLFKNPKDLDGAC